MLRPRIYITETAEAASIDTRFSDLYSRVPLLNAHFTTEGGDVPPDPL